MTTQRFHPGLVLPLLAALPLLSQTATTGAISGQVKDAAGKPIAGASARARSAQVQRTVVANDKGEFHFGLLNAGEWTLDISKTGFSGATLPPVVVTTNTVHPVQVRMAPVAQAAVEVVATALQVDQSTHTQSSAYLAPDLEKLPTGRFLNDLLFLGPGVEDSGYDSSGKTGWSNNPSVSGASSLENQFIVDGLVTNDLRSGFQGASIPKDWLEQIEVQTGGFAPEYSALGGVVVAVTKQGTNAFAGSASYFSTLPHLQARDKYSEPMGYSKPNDPMRTWDTTFTAGGPVIKDKLFYFIGGAFNRVEPDPATVTVNNQGLRSDPQKDDTRNLYAKLNWFPLTDHQLTFVVQDRNRDRSQEQAYPAPNGTAQQGTSIEERTRNLNFNWDWTLSSTMLLAVKVGRSQYRLDRDPTDTTHVQVRDRMYFSPNGPWGAAPLPPSTVTGSAFYTGGIGGYTTENTVTTGQYRADFSWLLDQHALKLGISRSLPEWEVHSRTSGGYSIDIYQFNSGAQRFNFRGLQRSLSSRDSRATGDYFALYAQDTWELSPGFHLKYGARYERQELKDTQGSTFFKFSNWKDVTQPRIGFTWDLKGDGRTKLAGSYGRYYEQIPLNPVMATGGGWTYITESYSPARATYNLATRTWAITGPPDGIAGIGPAVNDYSAHWATRPPIQEGIKIPQRDEFTLGLDHQFASGWLVGTHLRWRKMTNIIEDSVLTDRDGNPIDGEGFAILWNPKAGATVRWRNNAEHSNPGALNVWVNDVFPTAYNLYKALDLTLAKRGSDYNFEFSYTLSRFEGSYQGLATQWQAAANVSWTYDYWPYTGVGLLPLDHTHSLKLAANKSFPLFGHTFTLGTVARATSGIPSTDYDEENNFGYYFASSIIDGRYGNHGRLPSQAVVDLNLRYVMAFGRIRVTPTVDVFNLFNKRTVTGVDENKAYAEYPYPEGNPTWRMPWAWLPGRNLRWGVAVQF